MRVKSWGIASCEKCKTLNAFEKAAAALLDLESPSMAPLVKEVQRTHEEEISDHLLCHADDAPGARIPDKVRTRNG